MDTLLIPLLFLEEIVGIYPSISWDLMGKIRLPIKRQRKSALFLVDSRYASLLDSLLGRAKKVLPRLFLLVTTLISCTTQNAAFQKELSIHGVFLLPN